MKTRWQIRIEDPSGETRRVEINGHSTLGRGENASILLRDPTVSPEAMTIWPTSDLLPSPFWFRVSESTSSVFLADIPAKEALLPPGVPVRIGESRITLEPMTAPNSLPRFPSGVRPWLTATEEGRSLMWTTKKAASTSLSIYLAGETGTGKEVLAHLIHAWSERASGPFVPLHCGALPISLAESELFGHVKGAFTGAFQHRAGALLQAHGGTLFLDEIGDLPMDIQVKLLRFLENGEIRPVGADLSSKANVRLICATHHPLQKLVEEGKFRRDLYYRIASLTLAIPPLRSRMDDIELLAIKFATDLGKTISPKAIIRLQAHTWPGNVRELRHAVERASGLVGGFVQVLNEDAFSFLLNSESITRNHELELGVPILTLKEMERLMLVRALRLAHGHRKNAAKILGIARSTLFEMLKRHKIQGPHHQTIGVSA